MNWTQLTCEGLTPLFKERPCENYSKPPPQCCLLKERPITRLCETGRCIFAMIGFVQEKLAERFDHLDGREDIDLKQLTDRLKQVVWKGSSNPAGWLMYVKTAFQRATVRALAKQQLIPEEKNCGTCVHLPNSNPRVCQMFDERKNVRDHACTHYRFLQTTIAPGAGDGFDDLGEESEANLCSAAIERSETVQESVHAKMDVESIRLALARRVEKEKQGSRQRAIFVRQQELFVNLYRLLGEVDSGRGSHTNSFSTARGRSEDRTSRPG